MNLIQFNAICLISHIEVNRHFNRLTVRILRKFRLETILTLGGVRLPDGRCLNTSSCGIRIK